MFKIGDTVGINGHPLWFGVIIEKFNAKNYKIRWLDDPSMRDSLQTAERLYHKANPNDILKELLNG